MTSSFFSGLYVVGGNVADIRSSSVVGLSPVGLSIVTTSLVKAESSVEKSIMRASLVDQPSSVETPVVTTSRVREDSDSSVVSSVRVAAAVDDMFSAVTVLAVWDSSCVAVVRVGVIEKASSVGNSAVFPSFANDAYSTRSSVKTSATVVALPSARASDSVT